MNLPYALFSWPWHVAAALLALAALLLAARRVDWGALAHSGPRLNALLGFAVCMTLLWSLRAGVLPGLNLHLLGAMAACLMFGPHLALIALALVLTGISLNGAVEWAAWPINFLVMGVVPVMIAQAIRRLVERHLPSHFFVYIFVMAFAGSALVVLLVGVVAVLLLAGAGAYPWSFLVSEYLPYFVLLAFAEAWISGAVTTMMVVYRPEWVATFDDRRYLRR
ncbi:MAG: energy-coupling factor ABC transporter permease [Pseudazoarcus pumilus]|nr:energy-coupling factor ABC transporter permease [Pseudazoarcus pumilus]